MNNHNQVIPPIPNSEVPLNNSWNQDDEKKALFVGGKYAHYYKEKFDQITPKKQMAGFNLAAFFLGVMWLFYRKMYVYGFIAILLFFVMGIIETMLGISGTGGSIGLAVAFGLFGNTLYKYFVEKKIGQLQSDEEIINAGGTNIWAALILVGIVIVMVSFGYYLDSSEY